MKRVFHWKDHFRSWFSIILTASLILAYLPPSNGARAQANPGDWPQIGHDAQRTNFTGEQVDPPYCYAWKWYEAPLANRAQPVVAAGRLFIGSMEGVLYARDASNGAPLWSFQTGSPIRNSAGVLGNQVITGSYDGFTYAFDFSSGALRWKTYTGPSMTAPLIDTDRSIVYVASTDGSLTALAGTDGTPIWQFQSGAPILTSPSLSMDGKLVFAGNEDLFAFAVRARDGQAIWWRRLQGQSLADRYPVVDGYTVFYRSQPLNFFHQLLNEGDTVMNQAGPVKANWAADWNQVQPQILQYLVNDPTKQTFFALDAASGISLGTAPVLYTYGNNDTPAPPVIASGGIFLPYRARHGIQTDGGSVHVSSKYDAELGRLDLTSLDITGVQAAPGKTFDLQYRMTSDEDTNLSAGGDILFFDNWERLGAINLKTGQLIPIGNVSNDWPECFTQCGEPAANPFFPLQPGGKAYPFPSPRVSEGRQRPGLVIADHMLYWRVIEGGLAGIAHQDGGSCPAPKVWTATIASSIQPRSTSTSPLSSVDLSTYVTQDLAAPVDNPPADLVYRLQVEVIQMLQAAGGKHLLPYFVQRGFSEPFLWPDAVPEGQSGPPQLSYEGTGTIYWQDPGEFIYTMALVYPYLTPYLQKQVRDYVNAEINRYSPLEDLPWNNPQRDWLHQGSPREAYQVPFRNDISGWPPPAVSIQALYGLWLWSKNSGDWSFAQEHWDQIEQLWADNKASNINFYAQLSGLIGYARLADHFGKTSAYKDGTNLVVSKMKSVRNFEGVNGYAKQAYLDPRDQPTGWSVPVFFGLTPEVARYLHDQTANQAADYLRSTESENGMRWWYLTRAGTQAEIGESSFLAPNSAWSHFLAHAYLLGDSQQVLRAWLDRPWAPGDLYSLQKIVATIQAPVAGPDFTPSSFQAISTGKILTVTLELANRGDPLQGKLHVEIVLPQDLSLAHDQFQIPPGMTATFSTRRLILEGSLNNSSPNTIVLSLRREFNFGGSSYLSADIEGPGMMTVVKTLSVSLPRGIYSFP